MKKRDSGFVIRVSCAALAAGMISACSPPSTAYYNRGDPENLLDVSSEIVNVGLDSQDSLTQLADVIRQDPPTRAELGCAQSSPLCLQAKSLLEHHNVAVQWANARTVHDVSLVYERVVSRDCLNRYVDNSHNPYNLASPTFGCSLMANTVQQVSDKRQFVNPNLLDFRDADKAVQDYETYRAAPAPQPSTPTSTSVMAVYPGAVSPE